MTLLHAVGLLFLALLLIVLELFIPSGGILGLGAAAALIAAIIIAFLHSFGAGSTMLVSVAFLVPIIISIGLRIWPRTPMGRRMLNVDPDEEQRRRAEQEALRRQWLGRIGTAKMDLLPNGVIDVAGTRLDVVSVGGAIERGAFVEIVNVVAGKVHVRRTERAPDAAPPADEAPDSTATPTDQVLETPIESLGIEDFEEPFK